MGFHKSITFKLFILLFVILSLFACIVTYIHIFIIGRSYTISQYTLSRVEELKPLILDFAHSAYSYPIRNGDIDTSNNYSLAAIVALESPNNINMLTYTSKSDNVVMTENTKSLLGSYGIKYIKSKVSELEDERHLTSPNALSQYYEELGIQYLPLFHVYNEYNFPTKYVAFTASYTISPEDTKYIVALIPEVFTSTSSTILKQYMVYIFIVLLLFILGVSLVVSYFISRPVLKINRTASKIAALDFSEKCEVNGENEIGNLSNTINTMADNLQNTLNILNTANEKLNKDLNLQKELDMMRREFLGAVTHELKTPITLIKGYTESIIDEVAEGEERDLALKTIIKETENMDKLVKDLLDLSKLESAEYTLNVSEFYIDEFLSKVIERYRKPISEKAITLKTKFCTHSLMVKADNFRIEQVITNFMNNAIDFTPPHKSITLSLDIKDYKALISIHNEGKNILEEEIDRIWEKFYRVEKSRNKKFGGTGLGLAVSKSILDLHRSEYGVKNTDDGVTFYFTLEIISNAALPIKEDFN